MIPQRKETPSEHKWDLIPLFESDKTWEAMFGAVEMQLPAYRKYNGRLKDSVAILKEAIEFHLGLTREIEKLFTYAHLKSDEDKSNQFYLGLSPKSTQFIDPFFGNGKFYDAGDTVHPR